MTARLGYFRDVYDDIAGSRHYTANGDPLPVPISEVLAYCDMFHIDGLDEREKLLHMVRAMDRAFLDVIRKRREEDDKTKARRAKKPVK